jgi:hypothetical protein
MQDHESELPRIPLPRTWVNKGKEKGPGLLRPDPPLRLPTAPFFCALVAHPTVNYHAFFVNLL